MKNNYQTSTRRAGTTGRTTAKKAKHDAGRAAQEAALVLPDTMSVAVGELAGELEEGLLAFCVGAGLKVVQAMMDHACLVARWASDSPLRCTCATTRRCAPGPWLPRPTGERKHLER